MKKLIDAFFVGGDRMFDDFFGNNPQISEFPRFNIWQNCANTEYHVDLALPGWSKDNITVTYDQGVLSVTGCKQEVTDVLYVHKGLSGKSFKRSFLVPKTLELLTAELKDGLLSITFQPRAETPAKFIEIK